MSEPAPKPDYPRTPLGQWVTGAAPPPPAATSRHAHWKRELRAATQPGDVAMVWRTLIALACAGDVVACKEVLDRTVGKVPAAVRVTGTQVQLARIEVVGATDEQMARIMELATPAQSVDVREEPAGLVEEAVEAQPIGGEPGQDDQPA